MKQKKLLNLFLFFSIVIVLCNDILFNDIPELFPKSHEIGKVLSNLSLAYISSYIFYLVVVKYKEKKDKKNIYSTVYNIANQLIGRGSSIVTTLASADNFQKEDLVNTITEEEYLGLCKRVNPKEYHPNQGIGGVSGIRPATYSQLIYNNSYSNAKVLIERIFIYMPFLESDFIKLLNQLKESTFFIMADSLNVPEKFNNTDFEYISKEMFKYLLKLREIKTYIDENYNQYIS